MPRVMPLLLMYRWRITKYSPALRDERGAYQKDEWTSISDIGRVYEGEEFTYETYRKVEDAYVSTALSFVSEAGLDSLTITYFEAAHSLGERVARLRGIAFDAKRARKGMAVSGEALDNVCRLVLREILWCKLEADNGFYIHFGYDYYMYIGSPVPPEKSIPYGRRQGLFIEEMESPY